MTFKAKRIQKKIRRLQDRRDDIEYHLGTFGFGLNPSTIRRLEDEVQKIHIKLVKLGADKNEED